MYYVQIKKAPAGDLLVYLFNRKVLQNGCFK